jgi:hypothetical protein
LIDKPKPGEVRAARSGSTTTLAWKTYGESNPTEIERSADFGPWQHVGEVEGGKPEYRDPKSATGHMSYRLRELGKNGASAWSNPAWVEVER